MVTGVLALRLVDDVYLEAALAAGLFAPATAAIAFIRTPSPGAAKYVEAASGVWTLVSYLVVGIVPLLFGR